MGLKGYLLPAVVAFLAATTGSDLIARTSIGGEPLGVALREHLYYAGVQVVGTIFLLAPFIGVAFVCSRAEKWTNSRSVCAIFAVGTFALLYFYFQGYQAAQHALLEEHWTAAALSIGMLPFFIGVPVVFAAWGAATLAAKLDPRMSD
jgi:hypothetical protein